MEEKKRDAVWLPTRAINQSHEAAVAGSAITNQ
jgi:hypothetical protein